MELDNTVSLVNEDENDVAESVMTGDFTPLTQTVDVAKSIAQSHQRQPTENVALPSCSPAHPGIDLYYLLTYLLHGAESFLRS